MQNSQIIALHHCEELELQTLFFPSTTLTIAVKTELLNNRSLFYLNQEADFILPTNTGECLVNCRGKPHENFQLILPEAFDRDTTK